MRAARSVAIAPVSGSAASASAAIDGEQLELVGNHAARAACRELARWFELRENPAAADLVLTLELTEVRPSNRLAAGASPLAEDRRKAGRAWCDARYGKLPLAARGAARIIPLAPEAIDAGAPEPQATPDVPAEPPQ